MKPRHKPSYAPVLMAAGLMCTLWGAVTSWLISVVGLVAISFASARWIRDVNSDPQSAPSPVQPLPEASDRATVKSEARFGSEPGMASPWLHRYAVVLAIFTFALVIAGALVTSNPTAPTPFLQQVHLSIAAVVGILAIGLALWFRGFGWLLLAAFGLEAVLGIWRNPALGAFHALLAQLIFAATVGTALITTRSWQRATDQMDDSARLSLRTLSVVTLCLVVMQVSLGAAYRHKDMSVLPHIVGALVVTIAILLTAVLVTNQYGEHRWLRPAAKILIGITFAQVMLGMGAFITRLMMAEGTLPVVIIGVTHVATGSLTLAATFMLTLLIRHYLRPSPLRRELLPSESAVNSEPRA